MSNAAYFPVRYSQLDPDAVKSELVKRYKLEEPVSCRVFDYGLNDIYIVKAGNEVYYLRISLSNMHQRCDYEEEVFIISTLCKNGIHAAAPVHCKDGFYVWEINAPEGTRYAVLFTEAKKAPSEDKVKMGYNLGSELAKLHKTADEYDFKVSRAPIDLIQLADKPLHMLQPYLSNRTADYEFLCNAAEALCHKIEETLSCEKPYYGYCHGDIHGGNVFFDCDTPQIFDFDCMGYGWRAYDICVFAWNETFSNEKYIESDEWKAFLDGYNSIRRLSDAESNSISTFAALREIWLIGLHACMMDKNAGCSWYNDGYFDYHIGIFKLWYNRSFLKESTAAAPAE